MKKLIRNIVKDERGANLVEYIILLGVVALICIGVFTLFGDAISNKVKGQTTTVNDNINAGAGEGAKTFSQ